METHNHRGRTILREGRIEIREIPEHLSAEIDIVEGEDASEENCYLILIDYLSGRNASHRPVNLRAPVEQSADDQWVLAAPAEAERVREKPVVRFDFPDDASRGYFPQPADPRLHLRTIAPVRSATIWFAGAPSLHNIKKHAEQLQTFIIMRNLASTPLVKNSQLRVSKRGPFGILTEISIPLPGWPAGNRLKYYHPARGRGYRAHVVRTP